MTGVHRLQHVECLTTTNLTHHDAVRAHAKGVPNEIADLHFAAPLNVGRPALEPDDVPLIELKLDRVFDRPPVRRRE